MVEEQATVIECEGDYVWVQTHRQSSCGHCSAKGGCGTQVLSKIVGNKNAYIRCLNSKNVKVGDRILLGIEESTLLTGSFLIYLLPLLTMILFGGVLVFVAQHLWPAINSDLFAVFGTVLGLFTGLKLSRYLTHSNNRQNLYEPVILKKISSHQSVFKPVAWNKS